MRKVSGEESILSDSLIQLNEADEVIGQLYDQALNRNTYRSRRQMVPNLEYDLRVIAA